MIFGVILSLICCVLIMGALFRITQESRGKNPSWSDNVIYIVAPYGLAISAFYYIFFWRRVDMVELFAGLNTSNILADILLNIILPAAFLSLLFISYRKVSKIGWQFTIITTLGFILLSWLYIISIIIKHNRTFSSYDVPEFPIVQWSCAVFIVALVVAIYERAEAHRESLSSEQEPPAEKGMAGEPSFNESGAPAAANRENIVESAEEKRE